MAKKKIDSEIFKTLIIKDSNDIKDLLSGTIQTMLEAEIEHELGYAKHSMKDKTTSNASVVVQYIYDKKEEKKKGF